MLFNIILNHTILLLYCIKLSNTFTNWDQVWDPLAPSFCMLLWCSSFSHPLVIFHDIWHRRCVVWPWVVFSVPPHDVKRLAWNSTTNSSCPDSEHAQSPMSSAPLGGNAGATAKCNTKQSKSISGRMCVDLTLPPALSPCSVAVISCMNICSFGFSL